MLGIYVSMPAMLLDLICFPLFICLLCVLGCGLLRRQKPAEGDYPVAFYFISALLFLGFWAVLVNFFSGVNSTVYYVPVAAVFALGVSRLQRSDVQRLRECVLFALLLVPMAALAKPGGDAGLYHIPHQLLIRDEKIIFGLANLHTRYGFSSLLEYIGAPLWIGEQFKLLAYMQASFLLAWILFLWQLIRSEDRRIAALAWLTVASQLCYSLYFDFSYTSTDNASGMLFAMAFLSGIIILLQDAPVKNRKLTALFLYAAMAYMCKLSALIVLLWAGYVTLALLHAKRITWKQVLRCGALPALMLMVWEMKSFIVSGCLLYPMVPSCLDVVWSAKASAIENSNGITAWARQPGADMRPLHSWSWLGDWWWPNNWKFCAFIAIALSVCMGAYLYLGRVTLPRQNRIMLPAFALLMAALAMWFFKAPTARFGIGVFLILTPVTIITLWGFRWTSRHELVKKTRTLVVVILAAKLGIFPNTSVFKNIHLDMHIDMMPAPQVEITPDPNFGFSPVPPRVGEMCWTAQYCAPDVRPPQKEAYGYKYFQR